MSFLSPPNFNRPEGEPGALMAAATNLNWFSEDAGNKATDIAFSVTSIPGWSGSAFQAAFRTSGEVGMVVREFSNVTREASIITKRLAEQISQAQADVQSAQNRAYEIANYAAGLVNPVYGIFNDVMGFAQTASGRADDAKKAAAAAYGSLIERAPSYEPPPAPPESNSSERGLFSKIGHATLDVVGLVPVVGEFADGANAIWYTAEGDYFNAALSTAAMVPLLGYGANAVKATKAVKAARGTKAADGVSGAGRHVDDLGTPGLPPTTPLLNGSDRVPPINQQPPLGQRGPGQQGTRNQQTHEEIVVPPAGRPPQNTGYDRTPANQHRDPLLEALQNNRRNNPPANPGARSAPSGSPKPGPRGAVDDASRGAATISKPRQPVTDAARGASNGQQTSAAVAAAGRGADELPRPRQPVTDASRGAAPATPQPIPVAPTLGAAPAPPTIAASAPNPTVPLAPAPNAATPAGAVSDANNAALLEAGSWSQGPRLPSTLNAAATARLGVPPYSQVWSALDFKTTATETYVRVYFGDNTAGSFLAKKSDLLGLDQAGVIERLALPVRGNAGQLMLQEVVVPAETLMRSSVIGPHVSRLHPNSGMVFNGLGDIRFGNQYELLSDIPRTNFRDGTPIIGVVQ